MIDPMIARELRTSSTAVREWTIRRDRAVLDARDEGASLREIAELVGLTHPTVARICRDAAEVSA